MIFYAVVSISLALVFYTIGVWSERKQKKLKIWHVIVFWIGLSFDTVGTTLMSTMAKTGFKVNFHSITGLSAIALMAFHAVWAAIVIAKNDETAKAKFHTLSIFVWFVWLIPYISGAVFGIVR
jgi:uncharacterized repeat protein (TIGR03987 family)